MKKPVVRRAISSDSARRRFPDRHCAQVADWLWWQGRILEPDQDEAAHFLKALDPATEGFCFRSFSETHYTRIPGGDPLEQLLFGSLEQCWTRLVELNQRGAAIGVTINQTRSIERDPAQIRKVRALFVDADQPLPDWGMAPVPQLSVATSPGHRHHYWWVSGVPLERFTALQKALAQRLGTDCRVWALNQTMQLPGFWQRKAHHPPNAAGY